MHGSSRIIVCHIFFATCLVDCIASRQKCVAFGNATHGTSNADVGSMLEDSFCLHHMLPENILLGEFAYGKMILWSVAQKAISFASSQTVDKTSFRQTVSEYCHDYEHVYNLH